MPVLLICRKYQKEHVIVHTASILTLMESLSCCCAQLRHCSLAWSWITGKATELTAQKMVAKWPWMKELYNCFSRDKPAFQEKMKNMELEDRQRFKTFCMKVSWSHSAVVKLHSQMIFGVAQDEPMMSINLLLSVSLIRSYGLAPFDWRLTRLAIVSDACLLGLLAKLYWHNTSPPCLTCLWAHACLIPVIIMRDTQDSRCQTGTSGYPQRLGSPLYLTFHMEAVLNTPKYSLFCATWRFIWLTSNGTKIWCAIARLTSFFLQVKEQKAANLAAKQSPPSTAPRLRPLQAAYKIIKDTEQ